jgi:hypothetical protein
LRSEANRSNDRVAVPLSSDDPKALNVAAQLVKDAGFELMVVEPLLRAKRLQFQHACLRRTLNSTRTAVAARNWLKDH